jgi:hypothetical protein
MVDIDYIAKKQKFVFGYNTMLETLETFIYYGYQLFEHK